MLNKHTTSRKFTALLLVAVVIGVVCMFAQQTAADHDKIIEHGTRLEAHDQQLQQLSPLPSQQAATDSKVTLILGFLGTILVTMISGFYLQFSSTQKLRRSNHDIRNFLQAVANIDTHLEAIDTRMQAIDDRMDDSDTRLTAIETALQSQTERFSQLACVNGRPSPTAECSEG